MIKNGLQLIGFTISLILLTACGSGTDNAPKKNNNDSVKKDTLIIDTLPKQVDIKNYNRIFNDVARYIAGMSAETNCALDSTLLKNTDWKQYATNAEKKWHEFDSTRIQVLRKWSAEELGTINKKGLNLFYPFSGPDVLHANCFFANADTTVMVGLEPVGTAPFVNGTEQDTLSKYFRTVNNSLYAILNFSFFRTVAMKADLRNEQVNGTTQLMMIFLARTGNRVLDVKPIHIDTNGTIAANESEKNYKMPGVEITYCNADTNFLSRVFYFSCDLSNGGIDGTIKPFYVFLDKLPKHSTYLKSASYLMHDKYFSVIRDLVINKSDVVLQDDSGIPHKYFTNYSHTYYGVYTGVIGLFKGCGQKDLDSLYKLPASEPKPLGFGIGYKWHKGESNLVLYKKR
jgi:hypothetical protein